MRVSQTRHSRLAKHSATRGACTCEAGSGVKPNFANLSTSRPDVLPQRTTWSAMSTPGMAITHWRVDLSAAWLKLRSLITQPTSGGSNSIIVCHDIGLRLGWLGWTADLSTTG